MDKPMTDFDKLVSLTDNIKNPKIREFTVEFLKAAPEYFKHVPASSGGRYHPSYCLGEGGLVRHTIAATKILEYILSLDYMKQTFTVLQRDKMISAIMTHDSYKQGLGDTGHTVKEHEVIAKDKINEFLGVEYSHIGQLVLTHMGEWSNNPPKNLAEFLVHLSDYIASRKDIEVNVG